MDARARRRLAQAPCTNARMLQLVAALVGAQSPATTGATRCCVADQEDMGGALAKIAGRPWGGRRRGGKGMACDVGVTRRKWPISISHAVRRNRHACARRMPEKQQRACPPIHRGGGGFLAAFGMRAGQLTM